MKKNFIVLAVLLPLLVLVLIRTSSRNHFRNDAAKWTEPSVNQTNAIKTEQLNGLDGNVLIVNIDNQEKSFNIPGEMVNIPAKSLLDKQNQKKLRAHRGSIVLLSDDPALSARMWMLLSQMGYSKLYILDDTADSEILKYKFRPDTATGPEL